MWHWGQIREPTFRRQDGQVVQADAYRSHSSLEAWVKSPLLTKILGRQGFRVGVREWWDIFRIRVRADASPFRNCMCSCTVWLKYSSPQHLFHALILVYLNRLKRLIKGSLREPQRGCKISHVYYQACQAFPPTPDPHLSLNKKQQQELTSSSLVEEIGGAEVTFKQC